MAPLGIVFWGEIQIYNNKNAMKQPKIYEPVGRTLALYCQSDLSLLPDYLNNSWFPNELNKLGDGRGGVGRDYAYIEMGGGFHHYGYKLKLDGVASSQSTNVWKLNLYDENSPDIYLNDIVLEKTEFLNPVEMLDRVISGIDEQIRATPNEKDLYQSKIEIYLRFDQISEARQACKSMLKAMPDDWWAVLINAFLIAEEESFDNAEKFMIRWIKKNENFFRYMDLAYFCHLNQKNDKATNAVEKATGFDANTTWGEGGNSEFRGYTAAICSYQSGEYEAVIHLCDHLLPVSINGNYAKAGLRELRSAAQKAQTGQIDSVSWAEGINIFDPFEDFDIEKLIGREVFRPVSQDYEKTSLRSDMGHFRSVISSLVDKTQFEEAADQCAKGLKEFPNNWW